MIEIEALTHIYGDGDDSMTALMNVNLTIEDNEFVTMIGPSGCGKTTLLRIIGGLVEPSSGSVKINGQTVKGPGLDRAIVFQNFALMPWADVLTNAAFGLEIRGLGKQERAERAREYLELVGMAGFDRRLPKELSGGMMQRVGLARALAVEPEILLMDEPLGALDQLTRRHLQEETIRIWEHDRKTALFITHDMEEAVVLADRVVLMSSRPGRIEEVIEVDIPRPRDPNDHEQSLRIAEIREYLWCRLRDTGVNSGGRT